MDSAHSYERNQPQKGVTSGGTMTMEVATPSRALPRPANTEVRMKRERCQSAWGQEGDGGVVEVEREGMQVGGWGGALGVRDASPQGTTYTHTPG